MIFSKIWQRYFLKETLKVFFLFLGCFFFLYTLADYSMHMQDILKSTKISWKNLTVYYAMLFSKRCDLLLPLSLLIASVKVLTSLNMRNELLALQTAGIPLHKITRPFFFIALICVGLSYLNFEILAPKSLSYIDQFEDYYFKKKKVRKAREAAIYVLPLEDGSRLVYQAYDPVKQEFFDLFWILSTDNIYHMKTLSIREPFPVGTFVDELQRTETGLIEKTTSMAERVFTGLKLNFNLQSYFERSLENRSISELFAMAANKTPLFSEHQASAQTHLFYKLFMPWLPALVLIGIIPFCTPSRRSPHTFLIYSLTIFGYITFFTMMDGAIILGEAQVISPSLAIFALPLAFFFIFGRRFIKMCVRSI